MGRDWLDILESEVAAHQDMTDAQRRAFFGRAQGPRFATVPALTAISYGYPRSSRQGKEWRQLGGRIRALVQCIGAHIEDECRPVHGRLRSIHYLRHKVAATTGYIVESSRWAAVRDRVRGIRHLDCIDMLSLADDIDAFAQAEEALAARARTSAWASWVRSALSEGARAAHAWSKGPSGWQPSAVGSLPPIGCRQASDVSSVPLNDQETADDLLQKWISIWGTDDLGLGGLNYFESFTALPRLTVSEVRDAAASIKPKTAIGGDAIHHRWFLWLSDQCLERLIDLLTAVEAEGHIPEAVRLALLAFLPKLEGGLRPIGILPTVVRVWARARSSHALAWERGNSRDYFLGR